jgi:hypothetical protein
LASVAGAEAGVNCFEVLLHSPAAEDERIGDLLGAESLDREGKDLGLTLGEAEALKGLRIYPGGPRVG